MLEGLRRSFRSLAEKLSTTTLSREAVSEILEDFKLQLISNDVALEAAERIAEEIGEKLLGMRLPRLRDKRPVLNEVFASALSSVMLEASPEDLITAIKEKNRAGEPYVVLFVGPNGGGKTTTIAKVALYLKRRGIVSIVACSDTFRAAAIEQMRSLAERVGVRAISQQYGSDPASVALDAINSARSSKASVVLIDTAGRTEVNKNLLEEMRKIRRVSMPDSVMYVGDALTGNAAVEQARQFDGYVGIDYVSLSKLDADVKGGSAISICYITRKPILFVGTGQGLEDLQPFDKQSIISRLLS